MTIRDMEERTGISRANIRYYESQGLLHPEREANGYRNYSEADAAILLKIRLLRSMDMPLTTVKEVADGGLPLEQALSELAAELDRRQVHQERTRQLIGRIQGDFDNLDAERYLPMLESEDAWKEDAPPRLNLPWRRYWARRFDYFFYSAAVTLLTYDFMFGEGIAALLVLPAMLFLEPMLLSMFGTTPGKAIFGIRVTDPDGSRLDYQTALERTWTVMWEGMAMNLPLVTLYFQYKGLQLAEQEQPLSWENESELTFHDGKRRRYLLFAPLYLALRVFLKYSASILGG